MPHNPIETDERARSVGAAMTVHEHFPWRRGIDRLKEGEDRVLWNGPRSREEVAVLDRDVHVFHPQRFDHLTLLEALGVFAEPKIDDHPDPEVAEVREAFHVGLRAAIQAPVHLEEPLDWRTWVSPRLDWRQNHGGQNHGTERSDPRHRHGFLGGFGPHRDIS